MTQAPSIKEALDEALEDLQHFSDTQLDRNPKMQKVVTTVVAALATLQPSGERREAIARRLAEKWPGDYMQGDDECEREPNALAYETADAAILASGLVQDEAVIRADEREVAAQAALARIRKVRDGYANQAKFADVDPACYFREFVRRLDEAVSPKSAIRSARDGGAET